MRNSTPDTIRETIAANLRSIRDRMAAAARRSGREPSAVTLVAVTKYAQPEWVTALHSLGVLDFGESRPQQLVERAVQFPTDIRWHLIGHLQRNKIRKTLPRVRLTHSVDSIKLLEAIDRIAKEERLRPKLLLEVNISAEASKQGFAPDELRQAWPDVAANTHVDVVGLLTMAPLVDQAETARPVFAALRELAVELNHSSPEPQLTELSMGMSGDFEVAIEEGATLVRIGSRLFDGLAD